jgi:hypothetical protein
LFKVNERKKKVKTDGRVIGGETEGKTQSVTYRVEQTKGIRQSGRDRGERRHRRDEGKEKERNKNRERDRVE